MVQKSHDQNFKNLFLDFPTEALDWIFPQAIQSWGPVQHIEFLRQDLRNTRISLISTRTCVKRNGNRFNMKSRTIRRR